jgi:hypothetical protein
MRRALLLALATLVAAPAAACADEAIAELPRAVPVAGYAGWEAWSSYSERARAYALVLRDPQGATREAPVPAQTQPYDVSLGPDARGAVVAIYPRCTVRGCDLRRLYVEQGREQALRSVSRRATARPRPRSGARRSSSPGASAAATCPTSRT